MMMVLKVLASGSTPCGQTTITYVCGIYVGWQMYALIDMLRRRSA